MMKKVIYLSAAFFLILTACDNTSRRDNNRVEDIITEGEESVQNLFTVTYEDLREDKEDLQKDYRELQTEKAERAGDAPQEYDMYLTKIEEKFSVMDEKLEEFRNANDDRKEQIKEEFDELEDDIKKEMEEVKDNFKKPN